MTLPKYFDYRILYDDNTIIMCSWKQKEFESVINKWQKEEPLALVRDEAYSLKNVRTIVKLKPLPVEKPQEEENTPVVGEYDFVDHQTKEWLAAQGIDIMKGGFK